MYGDIWATLMLVKASSPECSLYQQSHLLLRRENRERWLQKYVKGIQPTS